MRSASSAKSIIMMAFFLTMPISSTMPISATNEKSMPDVHQRQQRADAGRGQRRQDRERVDEALVEHAQHDVDGDDGGQDQPGLAGERARELQRRRPRRCRRPWSACRSRARPRRSPSTASLSEAPGARLKLIVTAGNWSWCWIDEGRRAALDGGERAQRHLGPGARRDVDARQRGGVALVLRPSPPAPRGTGWPGRRWSRSGAGRRRR